MENKENVNVETSGTIEDSFKAATHGTDAAHDKLHGHPTEVFHAREETGRKAEKTEETKQS